MLAGQPPFTGATAESIVHQHVAAQPRPVTDLRGAVPTSVAAALTRALAKAPADRYGSAGEFARALRAAASPTNGATTTRAAPRVRRRRVGFAAAGLVVAAAAPFSWWWIEFRGRAAVADPTKKDLILVAQFDGPTDDPGLAPSVRNMITAALDQSGIVATLDDADLREALRSAGKPDSTRVDATLARELAYRRSIRVVLEGQVNRLGTGYSITTRLVDVENGRTLLSASETAPEQARLVPALERLGHRLRSELGERRAALRTSRPLVAVSTPDFEAYRLFIRGREAAMRGDEHDALRLFRAAIARDPQFGAAWRGLGVALWNSGEGDSARLAYEEAVRHSDRLSEWERLVIESYLASFRRDLPGQLDALDRALQASQTPAQLATALSQRGNALENAGRYEESCESYRLSGSASPFGTSQVGFYNLVWSLTRLGQFDEASRVVGRMRDKEEGLASLELWRERWAQADSIATRLLSDPGQPRFRRAGWAIWAVSGSAARGRVARAVSLLRGARREAERAKNVKDARDFANLEGVLAIYAGREAVGHTSIAVADTSFDGALSRALRGRVWDRREPAELGRLLADPRSRRPDYTVHIALLEGLSALGSGRSAEGKALLRPLALQTEGPYYAQFVDLGSRQKARWLMADVYEREGTPDSAAICLELLLAPVGKYRDLTDWRGFYFSFTHQRLVLLYARMGRLDDARRHWKAFAKAFDDPDPELRPLVDEARNALATTEAMAKGTQR